MLKPDPNEIIAQDFLAQLYNLSSESSKKETSESEEFDKTKYYYEYSFSDEYD